MEGKNLELFSRLKPPEILEQLTDPASQLLKENGYYLRQHHTGHMDNIRSVRYGR